jgi:hypothetical protein
MSINKYHLEMPNNYNRRTQETITISIISRTPSLSIIPSNSKSEAAKLLFLFLKFGF